MTEKLNAKVYRTNKHGELVDTFYPNDKSNFLKAGDTRKEPPKAGPDEVALLNHQTGEWYLAPDHRGRTYYTLAGTEITISAPGETIPKGAITKRPETPYHDSWDSTENFWVFNRKRCLEDLHKQIEQQKLNAVLGGMYIDGILWDTDYAAEIRLTQLGLILLKVPEFSDDNFYPNGDVAIRMDQTLWDVWFKANKHRVTGIFRWREESRKLVAATEHSADLMALFDTLKYTCDRYTIEGEVEVVEE